MFLSLAPLTTSIPVEQGDKLGHLLAYGGLMLWFSQLYGEQPMRRTLAIALVALGIGLEIAQSFTPYRTFEIADMIANASGVGIGWLLAPPRTFNFLQFAEKAIRKAT